MKISFSPYFLKFKTDGSRREGVLLKVAFEDGVVGYADCHPWTEVGDEPLAEQIESLVNGQPTQLMRSSLECAKCNKAIIKTPRSHFLGFNLLNWTVEDSTQIAREGFTHVKFKVGRNPKLEVNKLREIAEHSTLQLRLDFNQLLSFTSFQDYLESIEHLKERMDYIEDPFPYDEKQWALIQEQGWILACDKNVERAYGKPEAAKILIIKPARMLQSDIFKEAPGQIKIVTSYMAHPVEQLYAAHIASQIDPAARQLHGLLSHRVYEPNAFSAKLNWHGNQFTTTGGFINELEKLNWQDIR